MIAKTIIMLHRTKSRRGNDGRRKSVRPEQNSSPPDGLGSRYGRLSWFARGVTETLMALICCVKNPNVAARKGPGQHYKCVDVNGVTPTSNCQQEKVARSLTTILLVVPSNVQL